MMIYRVSGLNETPLDVSSTPTRLAIRQCLLRCIEPYVGSGVFHGRKRCCLVTVAGYFHHYTLRVSHLRHHIQWEYRGFFTHGDLSLLPHVVAGVVSG